MARPADRLPHSSHLLFRSGHQTGSRSNSGCSRVWRLRVSWAAPRGVDVVPANVLGQRVWEELESRREGSAFVLAGREASGGEGCFEPSGLGVPATHRACRGGQCGAVAVAVAKFPDDLARVVSGGEPLFRFAAKHRP